MPSGFAERVEKVLEAIKIISIEGRYFSPDCVENQILRDAKNNIVYIGVDEDQHLKSYAIVNYDGNVCGIIRAKFGRTEDDKKPFMSEIFAAIEQDCLKDGIIEILYGTLAPHYFKDDGTVLLDGKSRLFYLPFNEEHEYFYYRQRSGCSSHCASMRDVMKFLTDRPIGYNSQAEDEMRRWAPEKSYRWKPGRALTYWGEVLEEPIRNCVSQLVSPKYTLPKEVQELVQGRYLFEYQPLDALLGVAFLNKNDRSAVLYQMDSELNEYNIFHEKTESSALTHLLSSSIFSEKNEFTNFIHYHLCWDKNSSLPIQKTFHQIWPGLVSRMAPKKLNKDYTICCHVLCESKEARCVVYFILPLIFKTNVIQGKWEDFVRHTNLLHQIQNALKPYQNSSLSFLQFWNRNMPKQSSTLDLESFYKGAEICEKLWNIPKELKNAYSNAEQIYGEHREECQKMIPGRNVKCTMDLPNDKDLSGLANRKNWKVVFPELVKLFQISKKVKKKPEKKPNKRRDNELENKPENENETHYYCGKGMSFHELVKQHSTSSIDQAVGRWVLLLVTARLYHERVEKIKEQKDLPDSEKFISLHTLFSALYPIATHTFPSGLLPEEKKKRKRKKPMS